MQQPLNEILLIDDDRSTNFLHQLILERAGICEKIEVKSSATQALEYLKRIEENGVKPPDLIFLDLNMPIKNGWEFLEDFQALHLAKPPIVILSTSMNPADHRRAVEEEVVRGFWQKPLSEETLQEVISNVSNL